MHYVWLVCIVFDLCVLCLTCAYCVWLVCIVSDSYALIVTDLSSLQIQVRARDSGIPVKEAQVFATVNVARNPSLPEFTPDVYRATIKEDRTPGTSILRVTATDADGVSFSSIFFSFCMRGVSFLWKRSEGEVSHHSIFLSTLKKKTERENWNSNSETLIFKDSSVRSIWTHLTASSC